MSRPLVRRAAVLFVLTALLAAPWAAAEPRQDREAAPPPLLAQLWNQLASLLSDIGCIIDPGGRCAAGSAPSQVDIGCIMDPGGCGQ